MAEKGGNVVIRRVKKVSGGGHHGGAWKVAFADFATAMMAFFLLMWLIAATTKEQRGGIAEYFKNQSLTVGKSSSPTVGPNGPGGASTSMIKMGGVKDMQPDKVSSPQMSIRDIKEAARKEERKKLESLMEELKAAVEKSQALAPFKDQLLLDITPAGLRIQIVDKQNRPMFDLGSVTLKNYTIDILKELAKFINEVPNRISISGHTDVTPYANVNGYTNWELSADRANAARRTLVSGGVRDEKVAVVVGLGSSVLFDKSNPQAPINRRISIVIMTKAAEAAATSQETEADDTADDAATPAAEGAAPAAAPAAEGGHAQAPTPSQVPTPTQLAANGEARPAPEPSPAAAGKAEAAPAPGTRSAAISAPTAHGPSLDRGQREIQAAVARELGPAVR